MKILGFRSDPATPRYAIIENISNSFTLINAAEENRLCFPKNHDCDAEKITWLYKEFERIFATYLDICKVVIKIGEFTQKDDKAKRIASYQEAALLLYCGLHNITVHTKLYASLKTRSNQVKDDAIKHVGKTTQYWNPKMADAIMAARWGAEN